MVPLTVLMLIRAHPAYKVFPVSKGYEALKEHRVHPVKTAYLVQREKKYVLFMNPISISCELILGGRWQPWS